MFGTFKLAHEHLNIIPVRSKALSARWSQVNVGTNHRAKVVLKSTAKSPDCWVKCLRIEHAYTATIVVEVPQDRRENPASRIVRFSLSIRVGSDIQVLAKNHPLLSQDLVQSFSGEKCFVVFRIISFHVQGLLLPKILVKCVKIGWSNQPLECLLCLLYTSRLIFWVFKHILIEDRNQCWSLLTLDFLL